MGFFDFLNKNIRIDGGNEQRTYIPSMDNVVPQYEEKKFESNFVNVKEPINQQIQTNGTIQVAVQYGFGAPTIRKIILFEPGDFKDVKTILDFIGNKELIAVNLNNVTDEVAQRILDFISGASYSIGSAVTRHEQSIFVIAPRGVNVVSGKHE